jgi:LCP family protein required for cell wall assembly
MGSVVPPGVPDTGPEEPVAAGPAPEPAQTAPDSAKPAPGPARPLIAGPQPAKIQPDRTRPATPKDTKPKSARPRWHRRHRKLLIWSSASLVLLLVAVTGGAYVTLKHFNTNLEQDDIKGLLGSQPVDTHPQAENIMVLGSDSRNGLSKAYGSGLVTDQSDTLMIIHIPANRQWAEVMSIPRDSYVNIPACEMGDGQLSAPTQFKINEAFAIGNLDGNHTNLGVACTVKTLEQDTGIYINHFIVVNFTGFENMVSALGGVYECNPTAINDPNSNLHLTAGTHLLTPAQALGYVRARYTLGDGSDLERIGRQQAFMSSLVSRVQSKLLNPLAIYRFLDSATKSLTIDSQLGGITGLYDLGMSLRGIPSDKIAFFTIPNEIDAAQPADVQWTQPEDAKIFASFRDDVPASSTLFGQSAPAGNGSVSLTTGSPRPVKTAAGTKPAAKPGSAKASAAPSASTAPKPKPAAKTSPAASGAGSNLTISARTADQSICAG